MEVTLVELLRDRATWTNAPVTKAMLMSQAADRIEELEKTIHDACQELTHCMGRFGVCVCGTTVTNKAEPRS